MKGKDLIARATAYGKEYGTGRLVRKTLEHEKIRKAEAGYERWLSAHLPSQGKLERQRKESENQGGPLLSVLVPIYRTPERFLREMIESVLQQSYPHLELCLADGSGDDTAAETVIREYAEKDARVRYAHLPANGGISGNTNAALQMAEGEFVCLLDHDDRLAPDALYELAAVLRKDPALDAVYSDEDKVDFEGKQHFQPHFKPDFNLDLLRSNNYICHLFCVRTVLARKTGGFRRAYDGAQDYDFILRCTELAGKIGHVSRILYHWRCHPASTAANPDSKRYAYEAGKRAIEAHLERCHVRGLVAYTDNPGFYRVRYALPKTPRVQAVIPGEFSHAERRWLEARLQAATAYPDFHVCVGREAEGLIEALAAGSREPEGFVLFLNPSVYPMNRGWLRELVSHGLRTDAGCVTGRIYDEKHHLLHAGEVTGMFGLAAACPFKGTRSGFYGYMHKIGLQQDFTVVTGECLLIREEVLAKLLAGRKLNGSVPGLEEASAESWNLQELDREGWNIELCLKTQLLGLRNIYTPFAVLELRGAEREVPGYADYLVVHQERWAEALDACDQAYNSNLSLERGGWVCR